MSKSNQCQEVKPSRRLYVKQSKVCCVQGKGAPREWNALSAVISRPDFTILHRVLMGPAMSGVDVALSFKKHNQYKMLLPWIEPLSALKQSQ